MLQNLVHYSYIRTQLKELKIATQKPKILYDGRPLALNSNVKHLGLWIDENLNFDIYLKFVERKIAYAVGILNKLKCYFPKKFFCSSIMH